MSRVNMANRQQHQAMTALNPEPVDRNQHVDQVDSVHLMQLQDLLLMVLDQILGCNMLMCHYLYKSYIVIQYQLFVMKSRGEKNYNKL